jgi:hypothetical protein
LGRWVGVQREAKRKNKISAEREERLDSIGFVWKGKCTPNSRVGISWTDWDWSTRLVQLVEYKRVHGDCNVPCRYGPNVALGRWVAAQRLAKTKNFLIAEREAKLNSIGFVWDLVSTDWDTRWEQLVEYKQANGDCNVSLKQSGQHIKLGTWVAKQRYLKKKTQLSDEREEKLNAIGFCWNIVSSEVDWDVRFRELLAYFQTHEDFNVPKCYPRNPLLASWVSEQRNEYDLKCRAEQTSLTPLREAKLDAIGFTWIVGDTEEDAPMECVSSAASIEPEEAPSGKQVKSENNGVAVPDSITSG